MFPAQMAKRGSRAVVQHASGSTEVGGFTVCDIDLGLFLWLFDIPHDSAWIIMALKAYSGEWGAIGGLRRLSIFSREGPYG